MYIKQEKVKTEKPQYFLRDVVSNKEENRLPQYEHNLPLFAHSWFVFFSSSTLVTHSLCHLRLTRLAYVGIVFLSCIFEDRGSMFLRNVGL
jgi:hypothetical protein